MADRIVECFPQLFCFGSEILNFFHELKKGMCFGKIEET